jgi:hypothetical protein
MADGQNYQFQDWDAVAQLYGAQVAQSLQQNNVPGFPAECRRRNSLALILPKIRIIPQVC